MTSKIYLEKLKNIKKIMDTGKAILDLEIDIDKLIEERVEIKREMVQKRLITDIIQKSSKSKFLLELDDQSKRIVKNKEEITRKQNSLYMLQQVMEDEVRTGLAEMFHEAMLKHEKIIKKVMEIKKRSFRAQKEFQAKKTPETHQKWIEYSNNLMSEEYKLFKSEKEIETIKYAFRMEFGEE